MRSRTIRAALLGLAATALLSSCATPQRQRELPPAEPLQYDGWAGTFPSGLRVVTLQFAGVRRAAVAVSYAGPALVDPVGREGLARLAIALTERARGAVGGFTVRERLFATGAHWTAEHRADDVELRTVARPELLDEVLAIVAARLRDPLAGVTEGDFLAEREALAARVELTASPAATQLAALARRAAPGTPLDRAPPTASSVRAITLADVRAWVAEALVPARAVLIVTGPEPARTVAERAAAMLGPAARATPDGAATPPAPTPAIPAAALRPVAGTQEVVRRADTAPRLWIGWPVPGDAEGRPGLLLGAEEILRGAILTGLRKDAERVTTFAVGTLRANGVSLLYACLELRREEDASRVRDAVIRASSYAGVTGMLAHLWLEPAARELRDVGVLAAHEGVLPDAAALIRSSGAVDPLAARRAQADLFAEELEPWYRAHVRKDRAASVLFVPASGETPATPVPSPEGRELRLSVDLLSTAAPGREEAEALVDGPALGTAARHTLSNGLTVIVAPRQGPPMVEARLVIHPDVVADPTGPLATRLSWALWKRSWSFQGGWTCPAVKADNAGEGLAFGFTAPAAHLPLALEALSCWATRPFDAGAVKDLRRASGELLEELAERATVRTASAVTAAAYGEAHRAPPLPGAWDGVRVDAVRDWLARQHGPRHAVLVLAGKIEASPEVLAQVERWFGTWRAEPAPRAPDGRRPEPVARRVVLVDAPGAKLALATLALRLPPRAAADLAAERVLARALGAGLARSALPDGAGGAGLGGFADDPLLLGAIAVPIARAPAALREALELLARLAASPAPGHEVNLARWLEARSAAYAWDALAGVTTTAGELFMQGVPLTALDALPRELAAIDGERLRRTAAATSVGREVVIVTGDAAALEPALRAAGFAPERDPERAPAPAR